MSHYHRGNIVPLGSLIYAPPQNGYSPNCLNEPTGKWVLGLSALSERSLDLSEVKPVSTDTPLADRFLLQSGDFLISRSNTIDKVGRVGVFRGGLDNCTYPDLMMRFRPDASKIASSAESVGKYRFRQITKCMIHGCWQAIEQF